MRRVLWYNEGPVQFDPAAVIEELAILLGRDHVGRQPVPAQGDRMGRLLILAPAPGAVAHEENLSGNPAGGVALGLNRLSR